MYPKQQGTIQWYIHSAQEYILSYSYNCYFICLQMLMNVQTVMEGVLSFVAILLVASSAPACLAIFWTLMDSLAMVCPQAAMYIRTLNLSEI